MPCEPSSSGTKLLSKCCPHTCDPVDPNFGETHFEVADQPLGTFTSIGFARRNLPFPVVLGVPQPSYWRVTVTLKRRFVWLIQNPHQVPPCDSPGTASLFCQDGGGCQFIYQPNPRIFETLAVIQGLCHLPPPDDICYIPCDDELVTVTRFFYIGACYEVFVGGQDPLSKIGCNIPGLGYESVGGDAPFMVADWIAGTIPP